MVFSGSESASRVSIPVSVFLPLALTVFRFLTKFIEYLAACISELHLKTKFIVFLYCGRVSVQLSDFFALLNNLLVNFLSCFRVSFHQDYFSEP